MREGGRLHTRTTTRICLILSCSEMKMAQRRSCLRDRGNLVAILKMSSRRITCTCGECPVKPQDRREGVWGAGRLQEGVGA